MLVGCATGPWALFDVHAPMALRLQPAQPTTVRRIKKLASLHPNDLPDAGEAAPDGLGETGKTKQDGDKKRRAHWKQTVQEKMTRIFRERAADFDQLLQKGAHH